MPYDDENHYALTRARQQASRRGPRIWWLGVLALVLIAGLLGWDAWRSMVGDDEASLRVPAPHATAPATPAEPPAPEGPPLSEAGTESIPGGRYPVPPRPANAPPLPEIDRSDVPVLGGLAASFTRAACGQFFNTQDLIRRFVVTVDNLPREQVPSQMSVNRRTPGGFAVSRDPASGAVNIAAVNAKRYEKWVHMAEGIRPSVAASVYYNFYPLMQREFQSMGHPNGYFNDRVVAAIDDMLAAPEVPAPIRLVQPEVLYRYADAELEHLSAGRKIMVRMGPENAERVRTVLQAWRNELVHYAPEGGRTQAPEAVPAPGRVGAQPPADAPGTNSVLDDDFQSGGPRVSRPRTGADGGSDEVVHQQRGRPVDGGSGSGSQPGQR